MSSGVTLSISCAETEFETVSEKLKKAGIAFIVEKIDFSNESSSTQPLTFDEVRNEFAKRREVLRSGLRLVFVGTVSPQSTSTSSITTKAPEDGEFERKESFDVEVVNTNSDNPLERPIHVPVRAQTFEAGKLDPFFRRETLSDGVRLALTQSSSSTTLAEQSRVSKKAQKKQKDNKIPKHQNRGKGNPR